MSEEQEECGKPCDPAMNTDCCREYWERMEREGYWKRGEGWTAKGFREMTK